MGGFFMRYTAFLLAAFFLAFGMPFAQAQRVQDLPALKAVKDTSQKNRLSQKMETASQGPVQQTKPVLARTEQRSPASGIVAIVNDSVVSTTDLRARMGLALLSTGMPPSPELEKKLLPQVLRSLIDEQLQLQEGKKVGVVISKQAIENAMEKLAADNKIPGGDMRAFLKQNGIPAFTLENQIKATLTWNDVVMRDIRPRVDVGDDEIDAFIQRMRANEGKEEYLVSEILLAVDKPGDDSQVLALAEKLVEQLRAGAVFGGLARQFSQGLGAATGGDLGWIQTGQLTSEVDEALKHLQVGDVSPPVRSAEGYHILGLRDRRVISLGKVADTTVKLQQAFRPFSDKISKEELLAEGAKIKQDFQGCEGLEDKLLVNYPLWRWQDLGEVRVDTAPAWLAEKVSRISAGNASEPMATGAGALIVFVCSREAPEAVDRKAIRSMIGSEKMEILARRLQRDLRHEAHIDIRLQ